MYVSIYPQLWGGLLQNAAEFLGLVPWSSFEKFHFQKAQAIKANCDTFLRLGKLSQKHIFGGENSKNFHNFLHVIFFLRRIFQIGSSDHPPLFLKTFKKDLIFSESAQNFPPEILHPKFFHIDQYHN